MTEPTRLTDERPGRADRLASKGTLPDWFLPAADTEMVKVRKSRPA